MPKPILCVKEGLGKCANPLSCIKGILPKHPMNNQLNYRGLENTKTYIKLLFNWNIGKYILININAINPPIIKIKAGSRTLFIEAMRY